MPSEYEIRDPIHRAIFFNERERLVLDHPWIQRLRHVRQLGFVSLVYPGAVHDRFQHSVGVMHLAAACFRRLVVTSPLLQHDYATDDLDYCFRILRLAGLLHDVGHAPFSHTSEQFLPAVEQVRLPEDWYRHGQLPTERQAGHEDLTLAIVHRLGAIGCLDGDEARDVAAVLSSTVRRGPRLARLGSIVSLLRALVSGEMDADRCDYLLRDSHYTGVSYGVYDLDRLRACHLVVPGPDGPELGLDVHGVHVLEGLLLARYHMFLQVYFHKTPPAFEYYLSQAVETGEVALSLTEGVEDLLDLRDDTVTSQLHAARSRGEPWSSRILERRPATLVLRERVGAESQENFLAQELVDRLRQAGCHVFTRRSRQSFTDLAGAGDQAEGGRLLCERRILGRRVIEPVTAHSHLLQAFNRPIDLRYTYVLPEDGDRARQIMVTFDLG